VANFLIPTAIGLGANLLLSLLAPSGPRQQKGKIEDTGVPDAEFGFSLSLPFGRVRKEGLPMMWSLKLKERRKVSGGKGGGQKTETFSYFLTAAYPIAQKIGSVRRVWMNSVLVYGDGSDDQRSQKFLECCTIYTGNQTTSSSVIQANETNPVPAFKGWSYLVFNNYPIAEFEGSGFPRIDVEIVGESGENPRVKDILKKVCEIARIAEDKIDVSGVPDNLQIEGFDLLFEGTSFADQIGELLRAFFLIVRETKDKLVFKQQTSGEVTHIPRLALGAKKFGDRPIDLYEIKLTHFRETPSAVTVSGLNINKDQDAISVVAKDPAAKHTNELSIQTKLISSDNLFITLASRVLFLGRSQSKTFSKMFLLPAWDDLGVGDLISADGDRLFHREVLQITKKVRGAGYLIELEATRFQGYSNECAHIAVYDLGIYNSPTPPPNANRWITRAQRGTVFSPVVSYRAPLRFETTLPLGQISPLPNTEFRIYDADDNLIFTQNTAHGLTADSTWGVVTDCTGIDQLTSDILPEITTNLTFAPPSEIPASYGSATAIVIECPPVNSSDADLGFYLAIEGDEDYRTGTIFYSEDGGESYELATAITGESVTGTVLSFSANFNNSSPNFIDDFNTVRIRMDSGEIEPVTLEKFLAGKQLGWFSTGEILAFKNAEIVSNNPLTFDISYMIRGTKGTEGFIDNHAVGERFVLLTDYLVRLPVELFDVNREVRFKIVPDGLTETEVDTETIHTVTLESVKPFSAVVDSERAGGDVIISWYRRTRINGRWTDYIDVGFAPGELNTYTVRIYDGSAIKREFITETGERSIVYTASQQITDWGSVQLAYTVRVFQNSSYPVAFKEAIAVNV
jgi:hypothetical protein